MVGVGAPQLQELVEKTVEGLGYEFVDLERAGGGTVRVTLDAPHAPGGVSVEDCERVSHQLTRVFSVEAVEYERLEVSSPGLDRRLSRLRDFERFAGQRVLVQLRAAIDGRRRLRGRLLGVIGPAGFEQIRLELLDDAPTAGARTGRGFERKARRAAVESAAPVVVQIELAAIDRARLVPDLQFGSKR